MGMAQQLNQNHKGQLTEPSNKEEAMELTVEWDNPDMELLDNPDMEPLDNLVMELLDNPDMEPLDNLAMEQQVPQDKHHMEVEAEHTDHQDQVHTDQPQEKVELLDNPGLSDKVELPDKVELLDKVAQEKADSHLMAVHQPKDMVLTGDNDYEFMKKSV